MTFDGLIGDALKALAPLNIILAVVVWHLFRKLEIANEQRFQLQERVMDLANGIRQSHDKLAAAVETLVKRG